MFNEKVVINSSVCPEGDEMSVNLGQYIMRKWAE
jgi:hypothetical protein